MLKMKELTPLLNCRRLLEAVSCHHLSSSFVPSSAVPTFVPPARSRKRSRNFFASALVSNPSRCFVKRSAVFFFVSTRLTHLQNVFCFKKSRCNTRRFHCVFLHFIDIECSVSRYASPARKPSASKSSLGRRHSIEVCPTRMLDHPYSFCRVVSRGDPQEVSNVGLAALDSPLEIASPLSFSTRNLFSLPLALVSHSHPSRIDQGQRSHAGGSPADRKYSDSYWI